MAATVNIYSQQFRDDFKALQDEVADLRTLKQSLHHRLGLMIPIPPIPGAPGSTGTQTVLAGRILGHTGTSPDFAYDAVSNDGKILVFGESPAYRPFYPAESLPAPDGSPCLLMVWKPDPESSLVNLLYSCNETLDYGQCADQPPALEAAVSPKKSAMQTEGYSPQEIDDAMWSP